MISERILGFLDGTLSHEEEAELLHTLSVSPEKRELLRSFMKQESMFARDKQTIAVPYKAEQMLWQRMATVLPPLSMAAAPAAVEEVAQPIVSNVGFFGRMFSFASAAVAGATLVVGLGLGYLFGSNTPSTTSSSNASLSARQPMLASAVPSTQAVALSTQAATPEIRYVTRYIRVPVQESVANTVAQTSEIGSGELEIKASPLSMADLGGPTNASVMEPYARDIANAQSNSKRVYGLNARYEQTPINLQVGGEGIKPYLHETRGILERPKTLLERFEFGVMEHLGREYPNSSATNSSLPIITNSAFNTFYQLSPNSTKYWAGVSVGTANMAKKTLYTRAGNSLDRLQDVLVADSIHTQSAYVAGFFQYRVPAFVGDLTFSAGYGVATLGQMYIGEIGMHYDISREVGLQFALRGMQFYYSLASERDAAINSGSGSLVIPKGIDQASPSFNLEVGTGLYFHF